MEVKENTILEKEEILNNTEFVESKEATKTSKSRS